MRIIHPLAVNDVAVLVTAFVEGQGRLPLAVLEPFQADRLASPIAEVTLEHDGFGVWRLDSERDLPLCHFAGCHWQPPVLLLVAKPAVFTAINVSATQSPVNLRIDKLFHILSAPGRGTAGSDVTFAIHYTSDLYENVMKARISFPFIVAMLLAGAVGLADEFDSAGVKIHYTLEGKGEPVILIHGLYSSARMNWGVPGITAELAKHHRVIALDCRGHGQSGKPEAEGAYGVEMASDILRLMDHLHITKAQIVGYSMGGMIAMRFTVLHPERVKSVVLGGMGWHQANAAMNSFWESAVSRSNGRHNVPPACLHGFPALAVTEAEIKAVKCPVTIIVGDRDPVRKLYVEPLEKVRPDWAVYLVSDAGHLNCVAKAEFKTELKNALASVDRPAPKPR